MALGAISAGVSLVGGLFGGGGARAPRMGNEQKQLMQSQANLNNAMAERIRGGSQGCQRAQNGLFGPQCCQGRQFGPIGNCGMNGANGGFGAGPMQNIMGGFGQLMDRMSGLGGGFPGLGGGFGGLGGGFGGGFGGLGGFGGGLGGGFGAFGGGFGGFGGGFGGFGGLGANQAGINFNFNL